MLTSPPPVLDPAARTMLLALAARDPVNLFRLSGKTPDPWQVAALRSRAKRKAFLTSRQAGKSETAVIEGLSTAAFKPDSVVGVLTPGMRQSCRIVRRIRRALALVPHVEATNKATTSLTLSNGSEVVAWPGNNADAIRGESLDKLIVDEAAWVSEAAFGAAIPMVAMTQGDIIMASTPGGPEGKMFDIFNDPEAGADWEKTVVPATQIPRYSAETLEELRRTLGEHAFAVEMLCEWREGADAVFTADELARILGVEVVPDQLPGEEPLPDDDDDWAPQRLILPSFV